MNEQQPPANPAEHTAAKRTVVPAVVIGSALEWFDFYIFASMAALVLGKVFFPTYSSVAGTLASIATFAVGFIVRPLGAMFFGYLGDKIGRKHVLALTFLMMGGSTGLIGLIPSYETIGVLAPVLLVVFRLGQGFAAGAEFASAVAVAYEHAGVSTRGRFGSLPALGVNIGLFASSLTVTLLTSMDDAALEGWAWRIPFLASFVLVGFGYWVRRQMPETPDFERVSDRSTRRAGAKPFRDLFRTDWRGMGAVSLVVVGYLSASYLFKTFSLTYLAEFRGMEANVGAFGVTLASAVAILSVPIAGRFADRWNARLVLLGGAAGIAVLALPFLWALDHGTPVLIWAVFVLTTGITIPMMLAAQGTYFAAQFPTQVRVTGIGTAKETSSIVGGFAPFIAVALITMTPDNSSWPVALMFGVCVVSVILGALLDQQRNVEERTNGEQRMVTADAGQPPLGERS